MRLTRAKTGRPRVLDHEAIFLDYVRMGDQAKLGPVAEKHGCSNMQVSRIIRQQAKEYNFEDKAMLDAFLAKLDQRVTLGAHDMVELAEESIIEDLQNGDLDVKERTNIYRAGIAALYRGGKPTGDTNVNIDQSVTNVSFEMKWPDEEESKEAEIIALKEELI